jgi:hypothetical protein
MPDVGGKEISGAIGSPTEERRRSPRYPFTSSIEATDANSGERITGRASDIGFGGCYVETICPFAVGTDAKIKIIKGNESFEAQAKIVTSQNGMGMGVAFISALPNQIRIFQKWILEISGKVAPLPEPAEHKQEKKLSSNGSEKKEGNLVLGELLIALMRKGVLTEVEGKEMLKKLLQ